MTTPKPISDMSDAEVSRLINELRGWRVGVHNPGGGDCKFMLLRPGGEVKDNYIETREQAWAYAPQPATDAVAACELREFWLKSNEMASLDTFFADGEFSATCYHPVLVTETSKTLLSAESRAILSALKSEVQDAA